MSYYVWNPSGGELHDRYQDPQGEWVTGWIEYAGLLSMMAIYLHEPICERKPPEQASFFSADLFLIIVGWAAGKSVLPEFTCSKNPETKKPH